MKLSALILSLILCKLLHATTYSVSTSGGAGTWTPNQLSSSWNSLSSGDIILFKRGETFFLTIAPTKSGLTFDAYGTGANPVITSFRPVTGWTNVGGNKYTSSAVTGTAVQELLLDGTFQNIGRWPNANAANFGYLQYDLHTSTSITDNDYGSYSKPISNWTGGEVAFRQNRFIFHTYDVNQTTSGSSITFNFPEVQQATVDGQGYFFQNHIATLDLPGEWCYNKSTKQISIYLNSDPSAHNIQVTTFDRLVNLTGQSNITFRNIDFVGANENAVSIQGGSNITFAGCNIKYATNTGIRANSTNNLIISNCNIDYCHTQGINTKSSSATITDNTVSNTTPVLGMGYNTGGQGSAIVISGDNTTVRHNIVTNSAYANINAQNGSNQVIEYNIFDGSCQRLDDGGNFYTVNQVHDNSLTNKILRQNIFRSSDTGTPWIGTFTSREQTMNGYGDQWTNNWTITGNIFIGGRIGFYFNDPYNNLITNNTFYQYNIGIQINNKHTDENIRNNTTTGNVFFNTNTAKRAVSFSEISGLPTGYGNMNNNFFVYPTTTGTTFFSANSNPYSLPNWRGTFGYESTSSLSPLVYTNPAPGYYQFLTNETMTAQTYSLTGNWVSAKNISYTGSITLQPFTAEILLYGSGGNPPPPPPPPPPVDAPASIKVRTKYIIKSPVLP